MSKELIFKVEDTVAVNEDGSVCFSGNYTGEKIVRCENCENSEPWYRDKSRCFLWYEDGIDVFNDGFCSYGTERKNDDQTN